MSFLDRPRASRWRRWLFLAHLWCGLILGPVIGVVTLTGSVVVFRYELNRMTTPGTAYVTPGPERLTVDAILGRIRDAWPADTPTSIGWGEAGPDNAWNIRLVGADGHRIHTYVNQYTGEITGRDDYHDKWMQWFYDLHATLLAGDMGEFLNGFVGLATALLGLTGLVVWWPGRPHWTFGFRYGWRTHWPRQNYDIHKLVGFYTSLIVTVIALSGAYYSFPALYDSIAERVTGTKVMTGAPHAATRLADRTVPLEAFIRAAETAQPGTMAVQIGLPQKAGDPVTVRTKERQRDWHRIGLNYVYFEPADGRLIRSLRFSEATPATQAVLFMYPLHFGRFGGHWNTGVYYGVMVAYVLVGLAPFVLMVTGLLMYWNRSFVKKVRRARGHAGRRPDVARA